MWPPPDDTPPLPPRKPRSPAESSSTGARQVVRGTTRTCRARLRPSSGAGGRPWPPLPAGSLRPACPPPSVPCGPRTRRWPGRWGKEWFTPIQRTKRPRPPVIVGAAAHTPRRRRVHSRVTRRRAVHASTAQRSPRVGGGLYGNLHRAAGPFRGTMPLRPCAPSPPSAPSRACVSAGCGGRASRDARPARPCRPHRRGRRSGEACVRYSGGEGCRPSADPVPTCEGGAAGVAAPRGQGGTTMQMEGRRR